MPGQVPARIDKAALERIIQRASELQAGSRDVGENLTPEEVLQLGREVGLDPGYLQQALLEESHRAELPDEGGFLDRAVGPAVVSAQRVVQGDTESVLHQATRWIEENELFTVQRKLPGRMTWEPVGTFQAAIRRSTAALGGGKRPFMLAQANELSATVVQLEPGYVNIVLTASLRNKRSGYVGGLAAMAGASAAGTLALAAMTPFLLVALAPIPIGLGACYAIARSYRPVAERVKLGLECVLDQVEQGAFKPSHRLPERTPGLFNVLADEVRKVIKPGS